MHTVIFKDYSLVSTSLVSYICLQIPPPFVPLGSLEEGGGHTSRVYLTYVVFHTVPSGAPEWGYPFVYTSITYPTAYSLGLGPTYDYYALGI